MSEKIKVLLIEDSLGDVHLFSDMVNISGGGCIELNHNMKLSSGLERLKNGLYDVLILDLDLPESKGLDTLRAVRKYQKDIPIIVVTDNNNEAEEIEAAKLGAQDYLIKGHFDDQLLVRTIRYTVERKKQELKLKEANQLLETIFNSTNSLLAYIDSQFNYVKVNKAYARVFQNEPDFFTGKNHFELYPDPENEEIFKKVLITGEPYFTYAKPYKQKAEKKSSYWDWSLIPIKTNGDVNGLILTLSDVTERITTQKIIKEEKSKAQSYLDIAGVMFVVVNKNQKVTLINKKGCQILGYQEKEIIGKNWFDIIVTEEHREEFKKLFDRILNNEIPITEYYENRVRTSNGQIRIIAWRNSLIKDEDNNNVGILSSGEDITEEKKAKEALSINKARFEGILSSAMDAIISTDSNQKIILFNSSAEKMFRIKSDDAMGKDLGEFIPLQFREIHKEHINGFGKTNVSTRSMGKLGTITGLRSNGEIFPIEASISQVDIHGHKIYTVIMREVR